ncbi:hypothetical protein H257_19315, partial [Aphanomyces astaci]
NGKTMRLGERNHWDFGVCSGVNLRLSSSNRAHLLKQLLVPRFQRRVFVRLQRLAVGVSIRPGFGDVVEVSLRIPGEGGATSLAVRSGDV